MKKQKKQNIIGIIGRLAVILALFCVIHSVFGYLNDLVFSERQNQLKEVVGQYFEKVDLVTEDSWNTAQEIKERFVESDLSDIDDVKSFFSRELQIKHLADNGTGIIAIRSDGQYADEEGWHGSFSYLEPLSECEERTSFIYEQPFTGTLYNLYVYKLEEPVEITDENHVHFISFVGITRNMESMNQYFKCSAYGGENSTYILNRYGAKQYVDNSAEMNLIKGQNVYTVLRKEAEKEGKDFDELLADLEKDGIVYSDTIVSGEQCFYAMRKMPDTDYTIIYMNAANLVAMSTQKLVNLVIRIFLVIMIIIIIVMFSVFGLISMQNRRQLQMEAETKENLLVLNGRLDKANAELKKSMEATEEAFKVAEDASRSKSEFLSNMSHDIRTPMNAIMGMTTLIEHNADSPEKVIEYVDKIRMSSNHLLGLINEVLDMSKIESGKTELITAEFNIQDVIRQIETSFRTQTDAKKQTFTIKGTDFAYPWLIGDSVRLTQVLNNIISNAVKYTPEGGNIHVDVQEFPRKSGNYNKFVFKVSDNGIGMSEEFQKHIFESFSREESSATNKIQGTGLGMAIVKNIVDLMGGVISVESEKSKGSTFEVTLEFKIAESTEKAEKKTDAEKESREITLAGKKFLCAEDNDLNAEILKELLKMSKASCKVYSNGKELVEAFSSVKPGDYDAILMDVQMPVMDGLEATKAIRNSDNPLGKTIPIIAMTANAFNSDVQNCLDAGMDAHVSKPIDLKILERTLKKLG